MSLTCRFGVPWGGAKAGFALKEYIAQGGAVWSKGGAVDGQNAAFYQVPAEG